MSKLQTFCPYSLSSGHPIPCPPGRFTSAHPSIEGPQEVMVCRALQEDGTCIRLEAAKKNLASLSKLADEAAQRGTP